MKDYFSMFYKKILFQAFYLKMSCSIQSVAYNFFVIICKMLLTIYKINLTPFFPSVSGS